jgi:ankyrin repeat protein
MEAAVAGMLDLVTVLVNRQVEMDVQCHTTLDTALHFATANAHLEVAEFLAKRGASLCSQNRSGNSPLHLAVSRGYLSLVQFFLNCPSANLALTNALDQSLLALAIRGYHTEVAKFLINQGALLFLDQADETVLIDFITSEGLDDVLAAILTANDMEGALVG